MVLFILGFVLVLVIALGVRERKRAQTSAKHAAERELREARVRALAQRYKWEPVRDARVKPGHGARQ